MPIYEYRCALCGACFEALVDAGTERQDCRECGAAGADRVLSPPAQAFKLVRTGREYRKQDQRNRKLHEATKRDFKAKRSQAREAAKARKGGPS